MEGEEKAGCKATHAVPAPNLAGVLEWYLVSVVPDHAPFCDAVNADAAAVTVVAAAAAAAGSKPAGLLACPPSLSSPVACAAHKPCWLV